MIKDNKSSATTLSRRRLLRTAVASGAGLGALSVGGFTFVPAFADDQPPIGTWPAGSQGSTVTIGATVPRTGAYAVQGEDELKGMQLAVEHINDGHPLIKKIAPKVTKGVLGKQVNLVVADSGAKPNDAVQEQQTFINDNKIVAMTGVDLVGGRGGAQQVRRAREDSLSGGDLRLQRHHRQGLRALLVPPVLLRRDRRQRDRPGAGQEPTARTRRRRS